jgi:hypothetical protein
MVVAGLDRVDDASTESSDSSRGQGCMGCNLLEQGAFEAAIGIGCSLHFQNGFDPSRHVIGKVTRVEFSCQTRCWCQQEHIPLSP